MVKIKERYTILLRFFHPTYEPEDISTLLKLIPNQSWKNGDQAKTPSGSELKFRRKGSYWSYFEIEEGREFSEGIVKFIRYLSPHRSFIQKFVTEGGQVNFYLQLPGSVNIGDTLKWEILAQLTDLKVDLDIEIFPKVDTHS